MVRQSFIVASENSKELMLASFYEVEVGCADLIKRIQAHNLLKVYLTKKSISLNFKMKQKTGNALFCNAN